MVDANHAGRLDPGPLERGSFRDEFRIYRVRASSADKPDSFQVYTGEREDIVLIVSGLNSGELKATWGPLWRSFKPHWKTWFEESAFRAFHGAGPATGIAPTRTR
ncbi:hypothetical protein [Glycomyces buryatensis]|uniref:Uncharacterized protein n=1 Tax=Glycomyces buryatensis TaxID=2570927 RepID=A0A4S8QIJ4_9ACTN|nr:hypothetical protein [Glycomyces buryatensis]THV41209.1 hypothetical protein FAB82_12810 [Glycomyces buryatensis]